MLDRAQGPGRLVPQVAPGMPVSRLVLGRPVSEAEALLPRLFNLCRGAQVAALSAALDRRDGSAAKAVAGDVLRDHLLKLNATWPNLLHLEPRALPAGWRHGGTALLCDLFGADAAPDRADAFEAFLRGGSRLAVILRRIDGCFAPLEAVTGVLPLPDSESIWTRQPQENSVAGRHAAHPVMRDIEKRRGRGPLWRAVARLYDIEAAALGRLPCLQSVQGRAMVPAARGSYAIRIEAREGIVTAFDRVTPTDALLAEGGILEQCLATLPADRGGLAPLLMDILDPCVPVRLREVAHA